MAQGQSQGQGNYWDDWKKYYNALLDSQLSQADSSGDGKLYDQLDEIKREIGRIHTMGTLRDRVFNPQEQRVAYGRLGQRMPETNQQYAFNLENIPGIGGLARGLRKKAERPGEFADLASTSPVQPAQPTPQSSSGPSLQDEINYINDLRSRGLVR